MFCDVTSILRTCSGRWFKPFVPSSFSVSIKHIIRDTKYKINAGVYMYINWFYTVIRELFMQTRDCKRRLTLNVSNSKTLFYLLWWLILQVCRYLEYLRHFLLLCYGAVVFQRQYHRVWGRHKRALVDGLHDMLQHQQYRYIHFLIGLLSKSLPRTFSSLENKLNIDGLKNHIRISQATTCLQQMLLNTNACFFYAVTLLIMTAYMWLKDIRSKSIYFIWNITIIVSTYVE